MSGWKVWRRVGRVAGATAGLMLLTHCGGAAETEAREQEVEEGTTKQASSLESCQQVTQYQDIPLKVMEDTYVVAAQPDTAFEGSQLLLVDGDPRMEAFLRFSVDPSYVEGVTVTKARLRFFAVDGSSDGPALYRTGTDWSAATLTWNTRPARVGGAVGDLGAVSSQSLVEYDVTSVVTGAGTYGFALVPTSGNGVDLQSRENPREDPTLVLTVARTYCERQGTGGEVAGAWTRGGPAEQHLKALAMDAQGGFVAATTFYYEGGNFGGQTFTTPHAFALARYAADGTHLWSRPYLPYDIDTTVYINDLTITPLGNILAVGTYWGTPNFGAGSALPPNPEWGTPALFIAKFSPRGDFVWARGFVPTDSAGDVDVRAVPNAVTTDANGSLIVTGHFTGEVNLGGETLVSGETFSQDGMFLAKYSWEGQHQWSLAVPAGTSNPWSDSTVGRDVVTNAAGQIFVGGTAGTGRLGASSSSTPFVAAYSPEGALLWSRALAGADGTVNSLAPMPGGAVAFGGTFRGSFGFAGGTLTSALDENGWPAQDAMLGVVSSAGTDTWAKRFGGPSHDFGSALGTDSAGNISLHGYTYGQVDFGGGVLGHPTQSSFTLARFTSAGAHRWSRVLDPRLTAIDMAVSPDGQTLLGNDFQTPTRVDGNEYNPPDAQWELLFLKFAP